MALSANTNPTQITPPRVAFLDPRTGLIAREWYRFLLSLVTSVQTTQEAADVTPDADSLISSYDAAVRALEQATLTLPASDTSGLAALQTGLQALSVSPASANPSQIAKLMSDVQGLSLAPPPHQWHNPRYGSFYDTTTQNAAAINTAYPVTFNTTDLSNGVWIGSPASRIYVDTPNVYDFQFSLQLNKASASKATVWIWVRVNGTDVANSATAVSLQGSSSAAVAAWNFVLRLNAGDYFELVWSTDDTGCHMDAVAATAPVPAIPSVILTVTDNISAMGV